MASLPAHYLYRTALCVGLALFALTLPVSGQTVGEPAPLPPAAQKALEKGLSAAQAKQWDVAIRYFNDARRATPGAPEPLFNLGLAEAQIPGRELRAIAWFEAYLALVPDAANAAQVRQQITHLDIRVESNMRQMIDLLKGLIVQYPDGTTYVAQLLGEAGDTDAALALLQSKPDNIDWDMRFLCKYLAEFHWYAGALKAADRVPTYPRQVEAYADIASAQIASGLLPDAKMSLTDALKAANQIPASDNIGGRSSFLAIADAQIKAGLFSDAKESLDRVMSIVKSTSTVGESEILAIASDLYGTSLRLSVAQCRAGQQGEADQRISGLQMAARHQFPNDPNDVWRRNDELTDLAIAQYNCGHRHEAEAELGQVRRSVDQIRDYKNRSMTLDMLAYAAIELGQRDNALKLTREAEKAYNVAHSQEKFDIYQRILSRYLALNEWKEAEAFLLRLDQNYYGDLTSEHELISVNMASSAKLSALKSLSDRSASAARRAEAWGDYLDAVLNKPLFLDDFKTTYDGLIHYEPQESDKYKAYHIFAHVRRPTEELVDRLRDVRDLQAAAQKNGGRD